MKFSRLLALGLMTQLFSPLLMSAAPSVERSSRTPASLINGQTVGQSVDSASLAEDEFLAKHVVAIIDLKLGLPMCTGILVRPTIVLTAAHCVTGSFTDLAVSFSLHLPSNGTLLDPSQLISVSSGAVPESWLAFKKGNPTSEGRGDLALLRLASSAPSSHEPFAIFKGSEFVTEGLPKGTSVLFAGFGFVNQGEKLRPETLQKVTLPLSKDRYNQTEAKFDQPTSGVCSGDSGGPSFIRADHSTSWQLYAINSYGSAQCVGKFGYIAVTRVASHASWLEQTIAQLEE
jgi:secreted trypsin-like serine protease